MERRENFVWRQTTGLFLAWPIPITNLFDIPQVCWWSGKGFFWQDHSGVHWFPNGLLLIAFLPLFHSPPTPFSTFHVHACNLSKLSVGDGLSRAYPLLGTSIYFPHSVSVDNGHSEPVAKSPWRRCMTRDLCSSPLQHSTIVPCGNVAIFGSLLPISVPGEWKKWE